MVRNISMNRQNSSAPPNHAAARVVRKLIAPPSSLYAWISGPPMTELERKKLQLADANNRKPYATPFG